MARIDWGKEVSDVVGRTASHTVAWADYRTANAEMIERTMKGTGPHATSVSKGGMRIVYNISTAYVPNFMNAIGSAAYLNRYDIKRANRQLGTAAPSGADLRERIDDVVAEVGQSNGIGSREEIYYGAVELNGAGIRYFGDACLVLKPEAVPGGSLVLSRNSYDLSCKPVVDRILAPGDKTRTHKQAVAELESWAGQWPGDARGMAVVKILEGRADDRRRMTTGMVSQGVLADEDYIELAKCGSFAADDLEECRLGAADAAAEARIADRLRNGPAPSFAELQWRHRRRVAEAALGNGGIPARVVMTIGRDRG